MQRLYAHRQVHILDAGAGTTFIDWFLLSINAPSIHLTAVDHDPRNEKFHAEINGRYQKIPNNSKFAWPHTRFLLSELEHLPAHEQYDIIFCISVLEHIDRHDQVLSQIHRVLRDGGLLILSFDLNINSDGGLSGPAAYDLLHMVTEKFTPVDDHLPPSVVSRSEFDLHLHKKNVLTSDKVRTSRLTESQWKTIHSEWKRDNLTFHCSAWRKRSLTKKNVEELQTHSGPLDTSHELKKERRSWDVQDEAAPVQMVLDSCISSGQTCLSGKNPRWSDIDPRMSKIGHTVRRALNWIQLNLVKSPHQGYGITEMREQFSMSPHAPIYDEVTGYYIPTLLDFGQLDLTLEFAQHLTGAQDEESGMYNGMLSNGRLVVFDTAQVLRGLVAVLPFCEPTLRSKYHMAIRKALDSLIATCDEKGRLRDWRTSGWVVTDSDCPYNAYSLAAMDMAAKALDDEETQLFVKFAASTYAEEVRRLVKYEERRCPHTHFWAYAVEGVLDLGYDDIARWAISTLERYIVDDVEHGFLYVVDTRVGSGGFVCTPGLAQLGSIWLKLGMTNHAKKVLFWLSEHQNCPTGGWYGSYNIDGTAFEDDYPYYGRHEVSWVNKFVLDLISQMRKWTFKTVYGTTHEHETHYQGDLISHAYMKALLERTGDLNDKSVLELGSGAGVWCSVLKKKFPRAHVVASDLSAEAVAQIDTKIRSLVVDSLHLFGLEDASFDVVFAYESICHTILHAQAYRTAARVLRNGGILIVISKNRETLSESGRARLPIWEDWLDSDEASCQLQQAGFSNVSYDFVQSHEYALHFARQYTSDADLSGMVTLIISGRKDSSVQ